MLGNTTIHEKDLDGVQVEMINLQSKPKEEEVEDGTNGQSRNAIYAGAAQTVERGDGGIRTVYI
jgi:hypothetical protein